MSLLHVMITLKNCNDHVLSLDEKIDDMTAASNSIFRRLSTLETSVNDVNDIESSRLCDDIGQQTDHVSKNLLLKLNVMESRLIGFINEKFDERGPYRGVSDGSTSCGNVLSQSCQTDFPESVSDTLSQVCQTVSNVNEVGISLDSSVADETSEAELYMSDSDSYSADLSDNDDDNDEYAEASNLVFTNTLLKLRRDHDFASFHLRRTSPSLSTQSIARFHSNRVDFDHRHDERRAARRVHFDSREEFASRNLTGLTETQITLLRMAENDQTSDFSNVRNPMQSDQRSTDQFRSRDNRQISNQTRSKRWLRVAGLYNGTTV